MLQSVNHAGNNTNFRCAQLLAIEMMAQTTTIYAVLALARTLSPVDYARFARLISRAENAPLPERAPVDEAIELYLLEACSLGRTAELAGRSRWDIIALLKEHGIPVLALGEQSAHEMDVQAEQLEREGIL